jgi:hypothetical protein
VPELLHTRASVVSCFAAPEALDAIVAPSEGVVCCRVAPDEVMLIGEPGAAEDIVRAAGEGIVDADPDAVVLDATDGWAIWTLVGSDALEALRRVSAVDPAGGAYTAGDVAHVPVRIVSAPSRLHLLVGAMWQDYLGGRLLEACDGLGGSEGPRAVAWTTPGEVGGP